jgi:4,5-DOPA dioxygenase extradiol
MARLPTIFVSHGSPMHAVEPGPAGVAWSRLGRELPRPAAIVVASAHWETAQPALTGTSAPDTIHDFDGFPRALHEIRYPAPGAPAVARRARDLLEGAGLPTQIDEQRGLDHGAWSPLLHIYPAADIAVVQLSVQPGRGGDHHLAVGRALQPLRDEGVLVLGSGHMTHNLREYFSALRDPSARVHASSAPGYVTEFREWVRERLQSHELDELAVYETRAPGAQRAHPTPEHFLPLLVAAGAAGDYRQAQRVLDYVDGPLAMDSYRFD